MSEKDIYYVDDIYAPNQINNFDDDEEKFEDSEFLQDVPYSSSSIDRSSIGSIPWADDAIKQNQNAWESVERMLRGDEPLPEEVELRNEIQEWQRKFPNLIASNRPAQQQQQQQQQHRSKDFYSSRSNISNTIDNDDTISNLSLNSLNDDDDDVANGRVFDDDLQTPTRIAQQTTKTSPSTINANLTKRILNRRGKRSPNNDIPDLVELLEKDLQITSVPITLYHRQNPHLRHREQVDSFEDISSMTTPLRSSQKNSPMSVFVSHATTNTPQTRDVPDTNSRTHSTKRTQTRLRMPPILNVLEGKRRFRGKPINSNGSFVQLTHVQQVKSAAVTYEPTLRRYGKQSAWQVPLTAATFRNRFASNNNRNTIVLPAIQMQSSSNERSSINNGNHGDGGSSSRSHSSAFNDSLSSVSGIAANNRSGWHHHHHKLMIPHHNFNFNGPTTATNSTTPSTGRSISAVLHQHHPRSQFSAFYMPYSASKFK